ncbi:unnamed protein product [Alternaria alternata]
MAPPQANFGTLQAELESCKHADTSICVRNDVTKQGDRLCRSCQDSHPISSLTAIKELVHMQFPDAHPNQQQPDYDEEHAKRDRPDYIALWKARDKNDQDLCAWVQIAFAKAAGGELPEEIEEEPTYSKFVMLMKHARAAKNEVAQTTTPNISVSNFPCGRADGPDQICDNCAKAVRDHGSATLKAMLQADGKTIIPSAVRAAGDVHILWSGE